jgi:hypothetical protein
MFGPAHAPVSLEKVDLSVHEPHSHANGGHAMSRRRNVRARSESPASSRVRSAAFTACEQLEGRTLFSDIVWVNRGISQASDTDNFHAVYGINNGHAARAIVDRAINDWESIIPNFNYAGGGNTFDLTITATAMPSADSRGDANITAIDAQGKPTAGTVQLDDNGAGDNWYFDPNIGSAANPDDSEFDVVLNAYAADASSNPNAGYDFYRTVLHEIGHALGIATGVTVGGNTLAIDGFLTDTGFDDPNTSTTTNLWRFSRNGVTAGFTKHGGLHTFEGPNPTGLTMPTHPNDLLNPGRTVTGGAKRRQLISDTVADVLRAAYGYTVIQPNAVNNMFVNLNTATDRIDVRGAPGAADELIVVQGTASPGQLHVTVGGFVEVTFANQYNSIAVNPGAGNDIVRIEYNNGKATTVIGGAGNDITDFAFATRNLSNITGPTTVIGGGETDLVYVYDNNNTGAATYSVTSDRFDRAGWSGFSYTSDIERLTMTTGTAGNTVNVPSTYPNQPVVLNSAGGNDVVNLGSATNGLQLIRADVQIQNDPAFTTININDTGYAAARNAVMDQWAGNFGALAGLAQATITWDNADVQEINVTTGGGDDSLAVLRCSERLNIKSSGGEDNLTLGNDTNGLTALTGLTTVGPNTPFVFSNLTLNDSGNTAGRTSVWAANGNGFFINGLAPQQFRYENVFQLNVRGGTGPDHYALGGVVDDNISIDGGAGGAVDSLAVDDRAFPGTLSYADIGANFMTRGTGGIFNTTYTVGYAGIESPLFYAQDSATSLNLYGSPASIPAGQQMTVFAGNGSDTITLHMRDAQGAATIRGTLGVGGGGGTDSLVINDSGSTGVSYTFQNLSGPGTTNIAGVGPANFGAASSVENITLSAGSGDDSFNIHTFQSGSGLVIRGNDGADSVSWTPTSRNTVTHVTAMSHFTFDGGNGDDSLNFFNDNNPSAWLYTRTNAAFSASRTTDGNYFLLLNDPNVETVYATGAAGADDVEIRQVRSGSRFFVDGAGGGDDFFIGNAQRTQDIRGTVGIYTTGSDDVTIDDRADTVGRTFHISASEVGAAAGDDLFGPGGRLEFGGVRSLEVRCGGGSDNAYVLPHPTTDITIELNAQAPGRGTGDLAAFAFAGAENPTHTVLAPGAGWYTFSNRESIVYSGAETTAVDNVAPTVTASSFEVNLPRQTVRASFSEDVSSGVRPSSITLTNLTTNQTIDAANVAVNYDASTNTASFTFPGFASGVLPDGDYRMTIPVGGVSDLYGNATTVAHELAFFFLQGDANRDRRVNLTDFNRLASNFGQSNRNFSQADFNYDGTVSLADFNILAGRFGNALGADGTIERLPGGPLPEPPGSASRASRTGDPLDDLLA